MENESYRAARENFRLCFELAGEYAKWLVSSLLLLHSGALAGLFQTSALRAEFWPAIIFGLGLLFALATGIVGWFNLQIAAAHYRAFSRQLLDQPTLLEKMPNLVSRLWRWAVSLLLASAVCLVVGAILFGFKLFS